MANTSSRTLRLLSLLQARRYWPGTELAERLGVSVRTLRRDVERLRELGYPLEAHRGVEGGYQLAAGTALPPLALDDEEAVALALGLHAAAQAAVAGIAESSVRALTKLVRVMPPRLRRRVEALQTMTVPAGWNAAGPTVDPAVLTSITQACHDTERLEFSYTAASGEDTQRHVEPMRLVALGRRWYLVAYDLGRHDWRSFRLDRLTRARTTGVRFRPRPLPAEDAAAFVRDGIEQLSTSYAVEALIDDSAAAVRDRVGRWADVEEIGEGRCRLRMTTDSLGWAVVALGTVGADFDVISPPELVEHVRDWADRFARAGTPRDGLDLEQSAPLPSRR